MKRHLLAGLGLASLLIAGVAIAGPAANDLIGSGVHDQHAYQLEKSLQTEIRGSIVPKAGATVAAGSTARPLAQVYTSDIALPVGTVVAAATPNAIAPLLAVVPTVAANAGVFLKTAPIPGTLQIIRNEGGNTIKVYPDAAAAINAGSAGASVDLATLKTLICFARSSVKWECTWGQAS